MFKRIKENGKEFGFGNSTIGKNQRIVNKDGSFNVSRRGLNIFQRFSFFHWMINSKWSVFLGIVVLGFLTSNAIFAFIYDVVLGVNHFHGIETHSPLKNYFELFFFSSQTYTTVGYGRINPATTISSFVAAIDALSGVLYFAIVTGLLYGRFSKPVPKIQFSKIGVVAPYKEGFAFMFRVANKLNHQLQNAEVRLIASEIVDENGRASRQFFELELERKEIVFFATSWTIVHPIDEKSPFFNMGEEEFNRNEPEFMLQLKVYDQSYSQDTFTNTSYRKEEIVWNAVFEKILISNENINYVDFAKFNDVNYIS
ncbi:MAG: ion transporter [Bacteroidota bacterium]|nr:ion transporter [Bacteroidota bacterium]